MPDAPRTTGDLFKAKVVSPDDVDAIVDGWIEDQAEGMIPLGWGYAIDVFAAVAAHRPAREAMAIIDTPEGLKRTMVRTAILLGTPERA